MDGYSVFHRRYWGVLRRLPNPPPHVMPRLRALGCPPPHVWRCAHRYLDGLRTRWRV